MMKSTLIFASVALAAFCILPTPAAAATTATAKADASGETSIQGTAKVNLKTSGAVQRAKPLKNGKRVKVQIHKSGKGRVDIGKQIAIKNRIIFSKKNQKKLKKQLNRQKRFAKKAAIEVKKKSTKKVRLDKKLEKKIALKRKLEAKLDASLKIKADATATMTQKQAQKVELSGHISGSVQISIGTNPQKKLKDVEKEIKKAKAQQKQAQKDIDKTEKKLEKTNAAIEDTQKTIEETSTIVEEAANEQQQVEQEIEQLEEQLETEQTNQESAEEELTQWEQEELTPTDDVPEETTQVDNTSSDTAETTSTDSNCSRTDPVESIETVVIAPPPTDVSENDFGYEEPVWGCFEGEVMFLEPNTSRLPTNYDNREVVSRLYACEWNVPDRDFDRGFPGVENKVEWFAIRYSGGFNISTAGTYQFRINSDDGTKLFIDEQLIVDNDGAHPQQSRSGSIELEAGDHQLVLEYFQGPRYRIALEVFVTPPNGEEEIFSVR